MLGHFRARLYTHIWVAGWRAPHARVNTQLTGHEQANEIMYTTETPAGEVQLS